MPHKEHIHPELQVCMDIRLTCVIGKLSLAETAQLICQICQTLVPLIFYRLRY